MKPRSKITILILSVLSIFVFALFGCGGDGGKGAQKGVIVTSSSATVEVKDTEALTYDYRSLFTIKEDGKIIPVIDDYVDKSEVRAEAGTYHVSCRYKDYQKTISVVVTATDCNIVLSSPTVTVLKSQATTYDYKSLFTVTVDGKPVTITDDMTETDVQAQAGDYFFKVSVGPQSATLVVTVIDDVVVIPSYTVKEVEEADVADFDYTSLFSLYVEGKAARVERDMIEIPSLDGVAAGQNFDVKFEHEAHGQTASASVKVSVVPTQAYAVTAKHVVTYIHGATIPPETLFEIEKGGKSVPVPMNAISGEINYSQAGTNSITLDFNGVKYTATVEIKDGVVIEYASGDTVRIKRGTDKNKYPFVNDFKVMINGVRFYTVPDDYLSGVESVDFGTIGDYDVTLRIPYNVKNPGIDAQGNPVIRFDYTERTITYSVLERVGTVEVIDALVKTPAAGVYNVFNNLSVTVDGVKQVLTSDESKVGSLATYAEVIDGIDYTESGTQHIEIGVYVYGIDAEPVTVGYDLVLTTDIVITPISRGVFEGDTVYARDMFTITESGVPVKVTDDMVSGKVDTFKVGVYTLTLTYKGMTATTSVTVFDGGMKGVFKTRLTMLPEPEENEDDGENFDDYYGDGEYAMSGTPIVRASTAETSAVQIIGDLVISDDGKLTVKGQEAEILGGKDSDTLLIRLGSNEYTLYYHDGIIVLDPDNSTKLGFSDYKRPLVYFNEAVWNIDRMVTINYGENYVLTTTTTNYSIDTFKITPKAGGKSVWYALYVRLVSKNAADTVYEVKWGEAVYPDNFVPATDVESYMTFGGETYRFTMKSATVGKVIRSGDTEPVYGGKVFRGTLDGKSAQLHISASKTYMLYAGGALVFSMSANDVSSAKNSYTDYETDTLFLYSIDGDYVFSYKFILDRTALTFTIEEKDIYYGKYETDGKYIYLDGYGTGCINMDTSAYTNTLFKYSVTAGILEINFDADDPTLVYGARAEFYIGEFLNTLTVKSFEGAEIADVTFVNTRISDGAIVEITQSVFGADGQYGRDKLLAAINITTASGTLSLSEKSACVSTKTVYFADSGFYRYSIELSVGGKAVTSYYTVQIVDGDYASDPIMTDYGKGACSGKNPLYIDSNGVVTLDLSGIMYTGFAKPDGGSVKIKAYSEHGGAIFATLTPITDGVVRLDCSGASVFSDYYTVGTTRVAASLGMALREFDVDGTKTYVLSGAAATIGEVVTVDIMEGVGENNSIVKVTSESGTAYYKIVKWNDTVEGLVKTEYTE